MSKRTNTLTKLIDVFKQTAREFSGDDCMSSGAAIAYYTIFSLPPLLVIVLLLAGQFLSREKIGDIVRNQFGVPTRGFSSGKGEGESQGESGLFSAAERSRISSTEGLIGNLGPASRIFGFAVLLFSATGVLAQLQFALNKAWGVEPDPKQGGLKNFLIKRVLSLGMILVVAFLLLVSLVLTMIIDWVVQYAAPPGIVTTATFVLHTLASWTIVALLFASMYKILPDAKMAWRDLWLGSAITAALFIVGKSVIAWYLQSSQVGATWGSTAASTIGIFVWVYYTSLIVLVGAEFTQSYAVILGHGIEPIRGAVRATHEKHFIRADDGTRARHPAYEP